jgi:pimeloyl-ACP methyl ester carboxylesterase
MPTTGHPRHARRVKIANAGSLCNSGDQPAARFALQRIVPMSVRGWVSQGPGVLRRTPAALVTGALAAGQELVWLTAHALTYPIGLLAEHGVQEDARYRTDTLSPLTRGLILADIAAAGRPVVLVHGIGDNRSAFTVLRRTLRRRGFSRIVTVNYSPLTSDVRKAAAALAGHVERVCEQSGYEQVFLVGHSLGGIIARYYVQRLGGDARVSTLVTLGSPHAGSQLARIAPLLVGRQLRPDSDLMRELAGSWPSPPTRTRWCRTATPGWSTPTSP